MMTKVYASMAGNVWKIVVGVGGYSRGRTGCRHFGIYENGNSNRFRRSWHSYEN